MSGFLYYLPGHRPTISPDEIKAAGLAYAFENLGSKRMNAVSKGPEGTQGLLIADPNRVARAHMDMTRQTWRKHHGRGYWVGMWNDEVPTPDELAREKMLDGAKVILADDREWVVPLARRWSESDDPDVWAKYSCKLPSRIEFGKTGLIEVGEPLARYAEQWAIAQADLRIRFGEGTPADHDLLSNTSLILCAIKILQANYVIGELETILLGLLTQDNWLEIFDAFQDWSHREAIVEKKTAEAMSIASTNSVGPPSSNGQAETPLDTDQLSSIVGA